MLKKISWLSLLCMSMMNASDWLEAAKKNLSDGLDKLSEVVQQDISSHKHKHLTRIGVLIQEAENYSFDDVVCTNKDQYITYVLAQLSVYSEEIRNNTLDIILERNRLIENGRMLDAYHILCNKMMSTAAYNRSMEALKKLAEKFDAYKHLESHHMGHLCNKVIAHIFCVDNNHKYLDSCYNAFCKVYRIAQTSQEHKQYRQNKAKVRKRYESFKE